MEKNIVLVGFMGTGKSAIGQRLAQRLGMNFVDTDREIEKLTGMTVAEIFRKSGEKRFRSEEKLMAAKLARRQGLVVSCGGGMVLDPDNVKELGRRGVIIRLEANAEDIYRRVMKKRQQRPLLKRGLTLEELRQLMAEREKSYQCADIVINTTSRTIEEIVELILAKLKGDGHENPEG
ncbi:MAG: shikimate kinase [Syntrophomonadaceae bacterium]|nr:shikimate kinase [Syntrophomonadaceae bacterium]